MALVVNPNSNTIYVANYGCAYNLSCGGATSSYMTVIDGAAANSTTTVGVGTLPLNVAMNPNTNQIYVANYGSNNVTVITP